MRSRESSKKPPTLDPSSANADEADAIVIAAVLACLVALRAAEPAPACTLGASAPTARAVQEAAPDARGAMIWVGRGPRPVPVDDRKTALTQSGAHAP